MENKLETLEIKEDEFLNKNYRQGQLFHRVNCFDTDLGISTYTGKYRKNIDGTIMIFNDGKEVLSDFCTPVTNGNIDEVYKAITNDIDILDQNYRNTVNAILNELDKIK